MSSLNERPDGLDDCLSPTDIVLLQLWAIARLGSTRDYVENLRRSDWPLTRMTRQARRDVTKAMKGWPRDAINGHADEAERDVAFLWYLYLEMNRRVRDELRVVGSQIALLVSELRSRVREHYLRFDAYHAWVRACRDLPYPLDARTAAAVQAALSHQVESWSLLRDAETGGDIGSGGPTAADEADVPSRNGAAHVLVRFEGLAAAVQGIHSQYFRCSEIVFSELAERIERCRLDMRDVLDFFEEHQANGDPLRQCMDSRTLAPDPEAANSQHIESVREQIKPIVVRTGKRIAREIIREARVDAFVYMLNKDAARRIIDEELDEFRS